tara:strand:+ start:19205 stop:19372 length:168 start_codon:yes stop_codon:yes gene_type:complete
MNTITIVQKLEGDILLFYSEMEAKGFTPDQIEMYRKHFEVSRVRYGSIKVRENEE